MDSLPGDESFPSGNPRANPPPVRVALTVSQLNRAVAVLLERNLPQVTVVGEISNFTRAASGHWYFTLKDAGAQVRAVMFRGRAQYTGFAPREGMRVEVRATASFYEARGEFQLNVEAMRQAGAGDLYQRFLQLKDKLQAQGLFDAARKRPLPEMPRAIGVVTSPQAAALRDVLTTLAGRAPQIPVILYPTPVQGADAPAAIVAALQRAQSRAECQVLLLVRGGGSIEDLWAFNDEAVARAIVSGPIPVVSGVGHETDFTIADFAADQRAPTPTAAAALVAPDRHELAARLLGWSRQLLRAMQRGMQQREQALDGNARLLRPPSALWEQRRLRLQALTGRLAAAMRHQISDTEHQLARWDALLRPPQTGPAQTALDALTRRLQQAAERGAERRGQRLAQLGERLQLASPRQLLERGYAIVRDGSGAIVRDAAIVAPGASLSLLLARGELGVRVESVAPRSAGDDIPPDNGAN